MLLVLNNRPFALRVFQDRYLQTTTEVELV